MDRFELNLTLHPNIIERNIEADEYTFKHHFAPKSLIFRALNKIRTILK